jgi:hypothetical protein
MQKYWVDVTCIKCSHSVDIEIKKLNTLLGKLGFKEIEDYAPAKSYSKQVL